MTGERELDWRRFVNKMSYCFSCGRFGMPSKRGIPRGWKVLYQHHADAPPGLHVCSEKCANKVREAMKDGPVTVPIEQGKPPPMGATMMAAMMCEAVGDRISGIIGAIGLEPAQEKQVTEALTDELVPMMMPQSPDAPVSCVPVLISDVTSTLDEGVLCETAEQAVEVFGDHAGAQVPEDEEAMKRLVKRGPVKGQEGAMVIDFIPLSEKDRTFDKHLADDMAVIEEMHRSQGIPKWMLDGDFNEDPEGDSDDDGQGQGDERGRGEGGDHPDLQGSRCSPRDPD